MQAQPWLQAIPVVIVRARVGPYPPDGLSVLFLTKPFDLEQLIGIVTEAIGPANEPRPS